MKFGRLLEIHIKTKTTDKNGFHSDTKAAYEKAFDVMHDIAELKQDQLMEAPYKVEDVAQEAYDLLEEIKEYIYEKIGQNTDYAMDELLRWLALSTATLCGNQRKHLCEEETPEEDAAEPMEEWETPAPSKVLFSIKK